jgi:hypothetical protein
VTAQVVAVHLDAKHRFSKRPVEAITVQLPSGPHRRLEPV